MRISTERASRRTCQALATLLSLRMDSGVLATSDGGSVALSFSRQIRFLSDPEQLALMRRIDELSLAHPFYGSRQMSRHLQRENYPVGRDKVRRLMRTMGLEAVYCKPHTSRPEPGHRVYPYLMRDVLIEGMTRPWYLDGKRRATHWTRVRNYGLGTFGA